MTPLNYYNEFDPNAAAWLRQLIADKQIPDGVVDDRSITEITPHDLQGFTQCHFFAGVGGWPLALNLAGVPEDRPLWTASLPCQPFSTAGKQDGTADDRHLWPVFERLVRECRPPTILGEQVSSKLARDDWFPGVCMDLEALDYAVFGADLCAPCAGEIGEGRIVRGDQNSWERIVIGAPHIRQRLYWVANANRERRAGIDSLLWPEGAGRAGASEVLEATGCGTTGGVADASEGRRGQCDKGQWNIPIPDSDSTTCGDEHDGDVSDGGEPGRQHQEQARPARAASWTDSIAIPCRDGKARRVPKSCIQPLVNGIPRGVVPSGDPGDPSCANATGEARVMRLKGYGNAIVPPLAALFIHPALEAIDETTP